MPMLASTCSGRPSTGTAARGRRGSARARSSSSACELRELSQRGCRTRRRPAARPCRCARSTDSSRARDLAAAAVAVVVAERVVDLLEAVEVHQQHRELRAVLVGHADGVLDLLRRSSARFGQPGEVSCSAWCRFSSASRRSSSSACLRAVMSRQIPWTPTGRPSSSITRLETSRITVGRPWRGTPARTSCPIPRPTACARSPGASLRAFGVR